MSKYFLKILYLGLNLKYNILEFIGLVYFFKDMICFYVALYIELYSYDLRVTYENEKKSNKNIEYFSI
jgi:hypothetical protein